MSVRTSKAIVESRFNWLRIGGLSGTLSLHALGLILLAIPIAVPSVRPVLPDLQVRWIETPPEPVAVPVPDEPQPRPVPRTRIAPAAPRIPIPEVAVDSVMAVPEMPAVEPIGPSIEPGADSGPPVAGADVRLAYESIVRPNYPIDSQRRREQGTVMLRVRVGRDGMPREIEIARSSGFRQLDRAAREAVQRWRFRPVRVNGVAVEASGLVPVEFSIERG